MINYSSFVIYSDQMLVIVLYPRLQKDILGLKLFSIILAIFYHGRFISFNLREKIDPNLFSCQWKTIDLDLDCFVHIPQVQIDCMTFKKKRKIMTCLLHINGWKLTFYLVITVIMFRSLKDFFKFQKLALELKVKTLLNQEPCCVIYQ